MKALLTSILAAAKGDHGRLKQAFVIAYAVLSIVFLAAAPSVGVNGDARFHLPQSQHIMDFYLSFGSDQTINHGSGASKETEEYREFERQYLMDNFGVANARQLNAQQRKEFDAAHKLDFDHRVLRSWDQYIPGRTPQDYGSLYEFIAGAYYKIMGYDDIYHEGYFTFRRILNALFGLIAILFAALCAKEVGGWRAGLIALVFMFVSPRFVGHAFFNIKDIPFAAGYITAVYFIIRLMRQLDAPQKGTLIGIAIGIAMAINMRAGGLLLIAYTFFFSGLGALALHLSKKNGALIGDNLPLIKKLAITAVAGYFGGLLFWPYGLSGPFSHPFETLGRLSEFGTNISMLFDGERIGSKSAPWNYIPQWIAISVPVIVLIGFALSIVLGYIKNDKLDKAKVFALLFATVFPVVYVIYKKSNLYDGWRHLLFVYPTMVALAAYGFERVARMAQKPVVAYVVYGIIALGCIKPAIWIVQNHPNEYVYFNEIVGGEEGAFGQYETDYYMLGAIPALEWLGENENFDTRTDTIRVISDVIYPVKVKGLSKWGGNIIFRYARYYERNEKDYDYGIFFSRFIRPGDIRNGNFPPDLTIHTETVGDIPIIAVTKRQGDDDKLGLEAIKERRYNDAIRHLQAAVKEQPRNETLWGQLGFAYVVQKDYAMGTIALKKATELQDWNSNHWYYLGICHLQQRDPDNAIYALNQCIKLNPRFAEAYNLMSQAFNIKGEKQKVETYRNAYNRLKGQ